MSLAVLMNLGFAGGDPVPAIGDSYYIDASTATSTGGEAYEWESLDERGGFDTQPGIDEDGSP